MVETLGSEKQRPCDVCGETFRMKRYDQRFCSKACGKFHNNSKFAWADRPDREKCNQRRRKRYHENREENLRKAREERKQNPEKFRKRDRERYLRNKEKLGAKAKEYRARNPEIRTKEYRNARRKRPWDACLRGARKRASKKALPFDLTREWAESVWTGKCAVTDLPFELGDANWHAFSPSIDRVESSLGYIQSNCRFVLFSVNSLKSTGTDEQMLMVARAIVEKSRHQAEPPILYTQAPDTDFAETKL